MNWLRAELHKGGDGSDGDNAEEHHFQRLSSESHDHWQRHPYYRFGGNHCHLLRHEIPISQPVDSAIKRKTGLNSRTMVYFRVNLRELSIFNANACDKSVEALSLKT